ncbi:ferredoxin [Arthrobacter sp. SPG23]|uniref:ferredoxin n=1 Tax=Arthrobacter sp. SPG23 TaxID=1610703 RepID=UPI00069603E4|nr:ferredoxin [Arthrobacter sp. SPG23]
MSTFLHIDWTRCDGRGLCTELLSGMLDRDDWGYPVARGRVGRERTDVPLAPADLEAARDAVALCPMLALSFQDDGQRGSGQPVTAARGTAVERPPRGRR